MTSTLQQQADAILARAVMTVCDGWPKGVHPRRVLKVGDPARVSHGMCPACEASFAVKAGLAFLLVILLALPCAAQAIHAPAPKASQGAAVSVLQGVFAAAQAGDVATTVLALQAGAQEGNPAMRSITRSAPVFAASKAGIAALMIYGTHKIAARHRGRAIAMLVVADVVYGCVVANNARVIRTQAGSR